MVRQMQGRRILQGSQTSMYRSIRSISNPLPISDIVLPVQLIPSPLLPWMFVRLFSQASLYSQQINRTSRLYPSSMFSLPHAPLALSLARPGHIVIASAYARPVYLPSTKPKREKAAPPRLAHPLLFAHTSPSHVFFFSLDGAHSICFGARKGVLYCCCFFLLALPSSSLYWASAKGLKTSCLR